MATKHPKSTRWRCTGCCAFVNSTTNIGQSKFCKDCNNADPPPIPPPAPSPPAAQQQDTDTTNLPLEPNSPEGTRTTENSSISRPSESSPLSSESTSPSSSLTSASDSTSAPPVNPPNSHNLSEQNAVQDAATLDANQDNPGGAVYSEEQQHTSFVTFR